MKNKEKLFTIKMSDCMLQTFSAGGNGGQNQNKRNSGVRIIHEPSGARGESREGRTQLINKRKAFVRMAQSKEFQTWARTKALGIEAIEKLVDDAMKEENLLVEFFNKELAK